jgi:hypothetical protein
MFHVMSCNKYHPKTVRIVESEDIQSILDQPMMGECAVCGPCSHVEVGSNRDYWKVHTDHETIPEASDAAWKLFDEHPPASLTQGAAP